MTDTTTNTGRRTGLDRADMVAAALALVGLVEQHDRLLKLARAAHLTQAVL